MVFEISQDVSKLARQPRKFKKKLQRTPVTFIFMKKQLECNNYEVGSGQLAQRSE